MSTDEAINKTEYKVYGYIHRLQKQLKIINLPPIIPFTCLQFARDEDYLWSSNKYFTLTNDNKTVTRTKFRDAWGNHAIGNKVIDINIPLIARWTIKIEKCKIYASGICIGLVADDDSLEVYARTIVEVYNSGVLCQNSNHVEHNKAIYEKEHVKFGEGDTYQFTLNTKEMTIKSRINNNPENKIFDKSDECKLNPHDKWRFYIGLFQNGNSVKLIDFEMNYL